MVNRSKRGRNNLTKKMKNNTNKWSESARVSALNRRLKTIRDIALDKGKYVPTGLPVIRDNTLDEGEYVPTGLPVIRDNALHEGKYVPTGLPLTRHNGLDKEEYVPSSLPVIRDNYFKSDREEYVPTGLPTSAAQEKGITKMKNLRERARGNILNRRLKTIRDMAIDEEEYVPTGLPTSPAQEKGIAKMKELSERARDKILVRRFTRLKNTRNSVSGGKKTKRKWSKKYKRRINCKKPKGFSQKQYCKKHKGHKTKKHRSQKGGSTLHAAHKSWVCRGNIGCARNVNIY